MGDFVPKFERDMDSRTGGGGGAKMLPTAGAIPIRNERGDITMQKVKVTRYMAGKVPTYANATKDDESGGDSDDDSGSGDDRHRRRHRHDDTKRSSHHRTSRHHYDKHASTASDASRSTRDDDEVDERAATTDRRLQRLNRAKKERELDGFRDRHTRRVQEPEIVARNTRIRDDDDESSSNSEKEDKSKSTKTRKVHRIVTDTTATAPVETRTHDDNDSDEDQLDRKLDVVNEISKNRCDEEDEFERRRAMIKEKAKSRREEEELLATQQEEEDDEANVESGDDNDSDEDEESSSSDDDIPRLKPVFVRKRDRITLQETEKEQERLKQLEIDCQKQKEERKHNSAKLVEEAVKREIEMEKRQQEDNIDLTSVQTDDENEEIAYESWKVREMRRLKRDRDEREASAREKAEIEKVHKMTEEERKIYLRANPKIITNKQDKGKYKFLQKYFHRGVFFLDAEDDVLKRNFAEPTLDDRFDKSVLPKVMQVKDFGKAGRTKWTHLTNEDTTDHQGAWASQTPLNAKFFVKHAAGTKNVFERPMNKKRKVD